MDMTSVLKKGLKDMKVSRLVDEQPEKPSSDEMYPYGLKLNLDSKCLENLGLTLKRFKVGGEVELECRAKVVSVRAESGGYGDSENVELQVTHIAIEEDD